MQHISRRIQKETERLITEQIQSVSIHSDINNPRYFHIHRSGPENSPYECGIFELELFLPDNYPIYPPKVRFLTKIYHPNIDRLGRVSLQILHEKWSPSLTIRSVLFCIQDLMSDPNSDYPLDCCIGKHWKEDKLGAIRTAREWCFFYAC